MTLSDAVRAAAETVATPGHVNWTVISPVRAARVPQRRSSDWSKWLRHLAGSRPSSRSSAIRRSNPRTSPAVRDVASIAKG